MTQRYGKSAGSRMAATSAALCGALLWPAGHALAGSITEMSMGGIATDTKTIGARWTKLTGEVAGGADLTVGGVVVPSVVTTVPANTPFVPKALTFRYGFLWRNKITYTNTPSFTFDKPLMGAANQAITNSISSEARSPAVNPTNIGLGSASSVQNFDGVGAPTNVVLAGNATVTVTAGNSGKAAFYADDPMTLESSTSSYNVTFNQQINALDLGGDGNLATIEFDAYSSTVPTMGGLLYRLGFSLTNGVFDDFFYGSPQLGFTSQSQMDAFLANIVTNDLSVTTGPNASVTLKNGAPFTLFDQTLTIPSGGATIDVFDQGFAKAVPEPATWAMMSLGFAGLGYATLRRRRKTAAFLTA